MHILGGIQSEVSGTILAQVTEKILVKKLLQAFQKEQLGKKQLGNPGRIQPAIPGFLLVETHPVSLKKS